MGHRKNFSGGNICPSPTPLTLSLSLSKKKSMEREKSKFIMEKPGQYYLNQMIKVNTTSDVMWILCILDIM